jgi:hypothetical protein
MSIGRNVQDQKCGLHVKKNYEKKDEHVDPIGTHDTNAHHEPEDIERWSYD